jgi:hypothetical protein
MSEHLPRIARVEILWSENGAVRAAPYRSLAAADHALARAFETNPPPDTGGYDKTAFRVVWTDGQQHEGRADVTDKSMRAAPAAGGLLRDHLEHVGRWLRDSSGKATWMSPEDREAHTAWGVELLARLEREPRLGAARNRARIASGQLMPLGTRNPDPTLTLLPDARAATAALEAHFAPHRLPEVGWGGGTERVPSTTNRDICYATNWLSLALANDLPRLRELTGHPQGAIWDRWGRTVAFVRHHLGTDPDAIYVENPRFWGSQVPALAIKITEALQAPGARNADALATAERTAFRVTSRDPRGHAHVTYHAATSRDDAMNAATRYLGYSPAIVGVESNPTGKAWTALP